MRQFPTTSNGRSTYTHKSNLNYCELNGKHKQHVPSKLNKSESEMSAFKQLNTNKYLQASTEKTIDFLYWKQLSQPVLIKELSCVDYIDFSPIQPYNFAVTSSLHISIYNPITKDPTTTLGRFHEAAHGGTFGKDGRLLVAGDDQGFVKLFETSTKRDLRVFKGHTASVHRTYFTTDKLHIASFSDDKTVRIWDIASEQCKQTFSEHSDYVRAGCVSTVSPDILLSGGYDHKVKMYDTRTNSVVFEVDHGKPVSSVLFLPTGGIFFSAGDSYINVWDAFARRLIARMSQHNKGVTCLSLASNGRRLLSGGLDRKVKIYDTATYQKVHTLDDFPNGIFSMGVAPNDETVVVGMIDGMVSIQRMDNDRKLKTIEERKVPTNVISIADEKVEDYKKNAEARYNKFLRKYQYSRALDQVMSTHCTNVTPHITVALMSELIRRKGLERALCGRSNEFLKKFISFLIRYLGDRRFMRTLIDVINILLNIYEEDFPTLNGDVAKQFMHLATLLRREEELLVNTIELHGVFEILLSGAKVAEQSSQDVIEYVPDHNGLKPSKTAGEEFIVKVDE